MQRYKNLEGNSGVTAFEIGDDYIKVEFKDGATYLYNYSRPGQHDVEQMKRLAIKGIGLNSFIKKNVKENYASKS